MSFNSVHVQYKTDSKTKCIKNITACYLISSYNTFFFIKVQNLTCVLYEKILN